MTKIAVVLGSTREGSLGKRLWLYLQSEAKTWEEKYDVTFNFIDLDTYKLPYFYETVAPLMNQNRVLPENEQRWVSDVAEADGFLFLTPEYNAGIPAVLKNAIDYLAFELSGKAIKVVAYAPHDGAGMNGGNSLATLLTKLGGFVLPKVDGVKSAYNLVDENGKATGNVDQLTNDIDELVFYTKLYKNNPYKK